jgi:hypothetical protein
VPASWVEEATRSHIETTQKEDVDWQQGYGYQFWLCTHGAYRGDGAFGQFCLVMPQQDAVLVTTAAAKAMQPILGAAWSTLLPAMDGAPKVVKKHQRVLKRQCATLRLEPPQFRANPEAEGRLQGQRYELEENEAKLRSVAFQFLRGRLVLELRGRRKSTFRCGAGKWASGKTRRDRVSVPVRSSYTWKEGGVLEATVRLITTPFCETYTFRFRENELQLVASVNVALAGPTESPPVRGKRV